ncbi:MAG: SH3 domain-containing protein [Anaerolineaceae bacterium]|nr:SH3 domain-containing protein [Anaerolineaceae bacterium]
MKRNVWISLFIIAGFIFFHGRVRAEPAEQDGPTATPVQASLPTPLPLVPANELGTTNIPVTRTPTPEGSALLEAITEANVRSQPDPESDRLGTIRAGDSYTVIGRYYRWYQFQYSQSPSGTGWVFDELVTIKGNVDRIPDLTLGTPTPDISAQQVNSTLVVLTQTPGGVLTATAGVGALPLPIESSANNGNSTGGTSPNILAVGSQTPLPTFTIPPNLGAVNPPPTTSSGTPFENATVSVNPSADFVIPSRIPPILPILVLGGAGILGLIISAMRK